MPFNDQSDINAFDSNSEEHSNIMGDLEQNTKLGEENSGIYNSYEDNSVPTHKDHGSLAFSYGIKKSLSSDESRELLVSE
jgi:hypothetical protein